jgi:[NiFe] hydrogenase assembly HybE family chaperone
MDTTPEALRKSLETLYREIGETRMEGVPILNEKLEVAALGFEPWQENALGVLLTPWFMNLVLVPLDQEKFIESAPEIGEKRLLNLPAGQVEFILFFEEGFGWSLSCSLFSPMFGFEDQAAALETAQAALDEILNEAAELEEPEQEMRDIWDGKLPEPELAGEETPDTPAKNMDRRTFLRGTVPPAGTDGNSAIETGESA